MTKEQVFEMLTRAAAYLGTTVEHLWDVVVRQVYVGGARQLVFALLAGVAGTVCYKWTILAYEEGEAAKKAGGYDDPTIIILCGIGTAAMALTATMLATAAIGRFVNPEWYAIVMLKELMTRGIQ